MSQNTTGIDSGTKIPVMIKFVSTKGKDISHGSMDPYEAEVLMKSGATKTVLSVTPANLEDADYILEELGASYFNLMITYGLNNEPYFIVTIEIVD